MKKHFGILIVLLVGISVAIVPNSVHAMTTQDLAGKIYKVTSYAKGDDGSQQEWGAPKYLFINNKGKCITVDDPSRLDSSDSDDKKEIKKTNKEINTLISNRKKSKKIFKKDGSQIRITGNVTREIIKDDDHHGAEIVSEEPLTLMTKLDDPAVSYFAANGESVNVYYNLTPADQSMQYKFNW